MAKKHGKKYEDAKKQVDVTKEYTASEAIELVKKVAPANFDETVEVAVRLGVDLVKRINKSVARSFFQMVRAKLNVFLYLQKVKKRRKLKKQARTSLVKKTL